MDPRKKLERQMLKGFLKEFPSVNDERAEEILAIVYDDAEDGNGTQIPVVGEDEEPKTPRDIQDDSVVNDVKEDAEKMLDDKIEELEEEQADEPEINSFDDALEQMRKENEEYKEQAEEHFGDDEDE